LSYCSREEDQKRSRQAWVLIKQEQGRAGIAQRKNLKNSNMKKVT
jgi:hypothetical protein